ncbi:uncharacterized protein LOC119684561 [Teleopsis dalmanni]|uniref:uncharacterized protein LOC119684561 n=1 Tax=Teleopsis dalmanni TaxID=139649 RepID=UPI000D3294DA|nr:uncharacterized protein LOC119684561 [Teleopsis dalmanni]
MSSRDKETEKKLHMQSDKLRLCYQSLNNLEKIQQQITNLEAGLRVLKARFLKIKKEHGKMQSPLELGKIKGAIDEKEPIEVPLCTQMLEECEMDVTSENRPYNLAKASNYELEYHDLDDVWNK